MSIHRGDSGQISEYLVFEDVEIANMARCLNNGVNLHGSWKTQKLVFSA
jgi:hypothetical protein